MVSAMVQDTSIRGATIQGTTNWYAVSAALAAALALSLGACTSLPDFSSFRAPTFDFNAFPVNDWNSYAKSQTSARPVSSNDLVDGSGACPAMAAPVPSEASPEAAAAPPPTVRGVGLDMTECEVVIASGMPQSVNIGTNERGERTVIMTYMTTERSGTYRFVSGRLVSLERGPEAPAAAQTQKKPTKKQAKPKQSPPPAT
jgi:hypothetical protein